MRARPIRAYLDANVLIAYVADEEGRAGVVQSVLEDARGKKIELITSVLSITMSPSSTSPDSTSERLEFPTFGPRLHSRRR